MDHKDHKDCSRIPGITRWMSLVIEGWTVRVAGWNAAGHNWQSTNALPKKQTQHCGRDEGFQKSGSHRQNRDHVSVYNTAVVSFNSWASL